MVRNSFLISIAGFPQLAILLCCLAATSSAQTLPKQFFGVNVLHAINKTPWPDQPYAAIRLWDSDGTGWPEVNPSRGNYDWSSFDRGISLAKKQKVDVLYTFGRVPKWANGGLS